MYSFSIFIFVVVDDENWGKNVFCLKNCQKTRKTAPYCNIPDCVQYCLFLLFVYREDNSVGLAYIHLMRQRLGSYGDRVRCIDWADIFPEPAADFYRLDGLHPSDCNGVPRIYSKLAQVVRWNVSTERKEHLAR